MRGRVLRGLAEGWRKCVVIGGGHDTAWLARILTTVKTDRRDARAGLRACSKSREVDESECAGRVKTASVVLSGILRSRYGGQCARERLW